MTFYYKIKIVLPMKYLFVYLNIMRLITGLRRIITYTLVALVYAILSALCT